VSSGEPLREGYTTGSAAAAAAKAATLFLLLGERLDRVEIPLPPGGRLEVPIAGLNPVPLGVRGVVIKDGGDDPDATHGKHIQATVRLEPLVPGPPNLAGQVRIEGGTGVGVVTRPGLPMAVGEAAINPMPRRQIAEAVQEVLSIAGGIAGPRAGYSGGVRVTVSVPEGARIARRTMNPRLGIVGGVSILGTQGTVKPFSHEGYQTSIRQALDVAKAAGSNSVAFATGRRSEELLMGVRPELPEHVFIQAADQFVFSLREAAQRGFEHIFYGCFFGKLVKMAQGFADTHARSGSLDFPLLADWCREAGVDAERTKVIATANTARQVLGILDRDEAGNQALRRILDKALDRARVGAGVGAGTGPEIVLYVFDFQDRILIRS
jgi:cobalt-precorrin-5B (C1)-methyltransferase